MAWSASDWPIVEVCLGMLRPVSRVLDRQARLSRSPQIGAGSELGPKRPGRQRQNMVLTAILDWFC